MRILYVSQYFPPEMGAPAARVSELAVRWAGAGHHVTVLTGFPNHPTGVVPPHYRGSIVRRERYGDVDVVRTFLYAAPNRKIVRRAASYGSFAASSVLLGPLVREVRRCDVVVATSPQFLCAVAGYLLSRAFRTPFVLEVRDLWPQSIVAVGVWPADHFAIRALEQLERFLYRKADLLVGVTDSFAEIWEQSGIDPGKIRVVKNGVDLRMFSPGQRMNAVRAEFGWGEKFLISYIGTHGLAHALERLLECAERLRDDRDVHFLFVGEGAQREELQRIAEQRGLDNVTFAGERPREQVAAAIAASDLVAVTLRDSPLFRHVIPSKLFEIMACERPILLAVAGEAQRIVTRADCGFIVPPEDVDAMESAIRRAKSDPRATAERGRRGRAFVVEHFDRDRLAERYLRYLEDVAGRV